MFYPKALSHTLKFEITLALVSDVVVYSSNTPAANYALSNLQLEYETISSDYLANEAAASYQVGKGFFYEKINHEIFTIAKATDTIINKDIDVPRKSMTGVLCLFTENHKAGERDSEKFVNPDISSIQIDINGKPNMRYSNGMVPADFWKSIQKRLCLSNSISEEDFYTDNKFGLWIDLRSHPNNNIHGGGLNLSARGCVNLQITRKAGGSGTINCHMFIVADALLEVMNSNLKAIMY